MHNDIAQIVKAVCAALVFSLLYVLIFALIIKLFSVPVAAVKPVNQVFKIIVIFAGGVIFLHGEKGLLKGVAYGALAAVCTYVLYGIVGGQLSFSWLFLAEVFICAAAGAISGVIAVNLKKNV